MNTGKVVYRVHALKRMFERGISPADVVHVLAIGETVTDYPDDIPYPSRLLLGWSRGRPIHVVAADNPVDRETIVITVYEPDPEVWDSSFTRRLS